MAGIDLTTAETKLALWLDAEAAIATGQSFRLDSMGSSRQMTRANLSEVRAQIEYWETKVKRLTTQASRAPLQRVIFRG